MSRRTHHHQILNVIGFRHPNQTPSKQTPSKVIYVRNAYTFVLKLVFLLQMRNNTLDEKELYKQRTGIHQPLTAINGRGHGVSLNASTKTSPLTTRRASTMSSKKSDLSQFGGIFNLRRVQDKDKRNFHPLSLSFLLTPWQPPTAAYMCKQHIFYLSVDCFLYRHRRAYRSCCIFLSFRLARIAVC